MGIGESMSILGFVETALTNLYMRIVDLDRKFDGMNDKG
jgi:hypothetical protein